MTTNNPPDEETTWPPGWAEYVLRLLLRPENRESVSGDLLEEYRRTIRPARGAQAADRWYVAEVGGFLWRATWFWAVLFGGAFLARTAYDWFVPTDDFHVRSMWTTLAGVATFLSVGFVTGWRSRRFVSGTFAALVTSQIAAVMSVLGAGLLFAIWHDPETTSAIIGSGGLEEVFVLPFMMAIPAVLLGTVGGAAGSATRAIRSRYGD